MRILYFTPLLLLLNSCVAMYGIHHVHNLTNREATHIADKQHFKSLLLDSTYETCIRAKMTKAQAHDYLQPLQYWEYNDNKLVWGEFNCLAEGFPNLKWTINKGVKSPADVSTYADLTAHAQCLSPSLQPSPTGKVAIIVWTHSFGRQNRRFLRSVKHHLQARPEITPYYFIADNLYTRGTF